MEYPFEALSIFYYNHQPAPINSIRSRNFEISIWRIRAVKNAKDDTFSAITSNITYYYGPFDCRKT